MSLCNRIVITSAYTSKTNHTEIVMKEEVLISDKKIEKLAKKLAKTFSIDHEEAMGIVYEEWDLVEKLFHAFGKVKAVHQHLVQEINDTYRIA